MSTPNDPAPEDPAPAAWEALRCRGERELADKILEDHDIRTAVEAWEEADRRGARQRLLGIAVRIIPKMSPRLGAVLHHCAKTLESKIAIELYVYPDAAFNAACVKPEGERLFILASSGLIEAFDDAEMRFVFGHELGHHLFGHHRFPLGKLFEEEVVSGPRALQLFAWARYAEISADRAGLACAGDIDSAARALFKVASGLSSEIVTVDAEALASQVADIQAELSLETLEDAGQRDDWFATHPFSPIRLRAAMAFSHSDYFTEGGPNAAEVDDEVAELMSLMDPSYLTERSPEAEALRRLLLAGGILVAEATRGISDEEIAVLERFFGEGAISPKVTPEAMREDLPSRIAAVKELVPRARRFQVVRDLCLVAEADGHTDAAERAIIEQIAQELDVAQGLIDRTLGRAAELD